MSNHGRIAFISTPKFRETSTDLVESFLYRHLYWLCNNFEVMTTGRTHETLREMITRAPEPKQRSLIEQDTKFTISNAADLARWRTTILRGLQPTMKSFPGMIHVIYELVEGRLDAVIHLTDWEDKSAKPDSAVLSREANVHLVPIATDPDTARAFVESWEASMPRLRRGERLFRTRDQMQNPPLRGLRAGDNVLAMVAHDNMKLEICRFAIENATHIFRQHKCVLTTGTTGGWIKAFMEAAGRGPGDLKKIRLCNSGPKVGDILIAYAVVQVICRMFIFLQVQSVSHPQESDIRLFEQAVASRDVHVQLATNVDSARLLIGA